MLERLERDQQSPLDPQGQHEYVTYGDVVRFLSRYWPVLAASTSAGLLFSILYLMTATPLFTADTQVLIEANVPHTMSERLTESTVMLDTPQVESQLAIIKSERTAQKVATRLGLLITPTAKPRGFLLQRIADRIFGDDKVPVVPEEERLAAAAAGVRAAVDARREGLSYAINITFTAADPILAAQAANAIADVYVDDQLDVRAQMSLEGGKWLQGRIDDLRKQMNAAALEVQQFKAKRDYRIVARREGPEASSVDPSRPSGEDTGRVPGDAARSHRNEEQDTLEELESRALTYRKIFESFLQAYAETVQRQSYPVTNARVITRASPPKRKTYPRTKVSLAAGLVAGAIFGLGIAFLLYAFEERFGFRVRFGTSA